MLTIDRLRLQLPPEYAGRAALIGRMVAQELAVLPAARSLRLERLAVPAVRVTPGASDRQLARSIAGAIHGQLKRTKG